MDSERVFGPSWPVMTGLAPAQLDHRYQFAEQPDTTASRQAEFLSQPNTSMNFRAASKTRHATLSRLLRRR